MATQTIQTPRPVPAALPAAEPTPVAGRVRAWSPWLCALASAVALYLCYFPVSFGALAWVALVPLLALVRLPARPRTIYLACFAGSMAFHWAALQWVRVADWMMYFAWVLLA